jgi:hypothetical protein
MGYIPGLAGMGFATNLQRDVRGIQDDQRKQALKAQKWGSKRGLLGMLGGRALDFVGSKALTGVLAGAGLGPLAPLFAKAITTGTGNLLGSSKMLHGKGPRAEGKSGQRDLLGSGYEAIGDLKSSLDESMRGQALGAAGSAFTGEAMKPLQMEMQSSIGKGLKGMGINVGAAGPVIPEMADTSAMDEVLGFQEGNYVDELPEINMEDVLKQSLMSRSIMPDMELRRDYKSTPEQRAGIERTSANRERMQGIMQMLDMDKSLGSSSVDDTQSAYLKSLSGSDTMGRQAHRFAYGDASTTTGPSAIDDTESAYLKSLSGSDVMGKQATRFSEAQDVYGSPSLDDSESSYLKSLQGSNRLGDLANLEQMRQGIGQARDASMDYGWLKELWGTGAQGGINPQYAQQQRTKLGMQMGGMPGVSSPIPYQDGGGTPSNLSRYISQMQVMPDMDIRRSEPLSDLDSGLKRLMELQKVLPDVYEQITSPEVAKGTGERVFQRKKAYPDILGTISAMEGDKAAFEYLLNKISSQDPKKQFANRAWSKGPYDERTGYQIMSQGLAPDAFKDEEKYNSVMSAIENIIYDPETGESRKTRSVPIERMISLDPDVVKRIPDLIKEIEEREKSGEGTVSGEFFQQGGYLRQYNLGGSVAQQPLSYQLGGLLKYKRSPMAG